LLVACLIWLKQNDLLKTEHARTWLRLAIYDPADAPPTRPLNLLVVPERVTRMLFNTIAPGLAGLVLLASSLWRSWLMGALVILAAAVIFAGAALGMPDLEPLGSHRASLAIGGLLAVLALTLARK
jgi:4-amino-4-deoxy-L-arabinose transferase-like glycosyltransferase